VYAPLQAFYSDLNRQSLMPPPKNATDRDLAALPPTWRAKKILARKRRLRCFPGWVAYRTCNQYTAACF